MAEYTLFPSILPSGTAAEDEVIAEIDLDHAESRLDATKCPFCDSYEGDYPMHHAPKAHPNRWRAFRRLQAEVEGDEDEANDAQTSNDAGALVANGGEPDDGS